METKEYLERIRGDLQDQKDAEGIFRSHDEVDDLAMIVEDLINVLIKEQGEAP